MNLAQDKLDHRTLHLLQQAAQHFSDRQQQAYLVGGSVRNLLLNETCSDWDISTTGDAPKLARHLANKLAGYYAHMHDKASRVVVKQDEHEIVFDIAPLHGNTIEEDLHQRDFTINAIASPFSALVQHLTTGAPLTLIDPLHGTADITSRCLRAVDDNIFKHDPLRMLRAARFIMLYQLTLEITTAHMLTRDAHLLTQAAPQRIHDELYALLSPPGATERLRFLDHHGLLTTLMPEFMSARGMPQPALHHWNVLDHSLETVASLERLATALQLPTDEIRYSPLDIAGQGDLAQLQTLLQEAEQQGIFQFANLTAAPTKLAALLHDIGKPVTYTLTTEGEIRFYHHPQAGVPLAQDIMQRLNASTHDRRLVQQVVAHHMRPGQLSGDIVTPRAIRRYFMDLGNAGITVALISLADHLAMRGPQPLTEHWARHLATVHLLLTRYIRERERIMPPRLLQAEELIRRLNLAPGPIIGQLLEQLSEAQTDGLIHSKDEALWFAEEKLRQASTSDYPESTR